MGLDVLDARGVAHECGGAVTDRAARCASGQRDAVVGGCILAGESSLDLRRRLAYADAVAREHGSCNRAGAAIVSSDLTPQDVATRMPNNPDDQRAIRVLIDNDLLGQPVHLLMSRKENLCRMRRDIGGIEYSYSLRERELPVGSIDEVILGCDVVGGELVLPRDDAPLRRSGYGRVRWMGKTDVRSGEAAVLCCASIPHTFLSLIDGRRTDLSAQERRHALTEAIKLGCELTSAFCYAPWCEEGFVQCRATATPSDIAWYARRCVGQRSRTVASRAAPYIEGGFRSPLEVSVYLLLCLPPRLGGYGIPHPRINVWLDAEGNIVEPQSTHARRQADMLWAQRRTAALVAGLILEVQGYYRHLGKGAAPGKVMKDIERMAELQSVGYEVMQVTIRQVRSVEQFHRLAMTICKRLGKRFREPSDYDWRARREELRRTLGV